MAHFKTQNYGSSYCTNSDEFDVYAVGQATGMETDYCTGCREVEPEWTILTQEEFDVAASRY